MKVKRFLFLIMLIVGIALPINAEDDPNPGTTPPVQPIKKGKKPGDPGKVKAPSLVMILFSYDYAAETAHFDLPEYVETIDITLHGTQSALTFFGTVSVFNPEWHQPLPAGEYIITCTADTGDIFEGYIYI